MKKLLASLITVALIFGTSAGVLAKPNPELQDGRNGNSEKNGSFELVLSEGPYYVGETATVTVANIVIDGPLDTLVVSGAGEVTLPSTPGEHNINVTATTYFKNGKKDGQIHTQITNSLVINVEERVSVELPVATSLKAEWNGHPNENNTVRVQYTITIDGVTINHHVNFNHKDREAGVVEVEKDGFSFKVLYIQP